MEWIDVSDRLPDERGQYIVCIRIKEFEGEDWEYFPSTMRYDEECKGWLTSPNLNLKVTHWMDWPELPEGRKQ